MLFQLAAAVRIQILETAKRHEILGNFDARIKVSNTVRCYIALR